MYKVFVLAMALACGAAHAQTPAINPMPDGSRDMYVGLGAQNAPRYEGAQDRRTTALPMLQVQWSNGIFISGMSMGMHLASSPGVEYGPLLALAPGRDPSGTKLFRLGAVGDNAGNPGGPSTWLPPGGPVDELPVKPAPPADGRQGIASADGITPDNTINLLDGVHNIKRRVLYGGFYNVYLAPQLRVTTNALYGAGNDRNGLRVHVALQHLQENIAPHHTLALSAGVTLVNRAYNRAYFGVTAGEADILGINPQYDPDGGIEDVRVGARWNWALAPTWMVTTGVQASRLMGDAKKSPLVERPTNVSVSTALVYRF